MKPQSKAYLYALAAIACWSTIGSAFKISLRYINPPGLLVISSMVATLALLAILVIQGRINLLRNLGWRDILFSAFLGLLNPFLYYTVLLQAYDFLKAQEAGTLNYIWPLVLVLLSIPMLKQKISPASILAILVSFAGILLISLHPGEAARADAAGVLKPGLHAAGIILALSSAIFWALYWIFNLRDPREAVSKLFLNFSFGTLYALLFAWLTGSLPLPAWQGLAGGIYLGLFEMGITFVLWLKALQHSTTTAKVSNLIYLSPFISLVIIHFAVGETILVSTIAGLALIVSGIILQQYLKR